jgi:hypothetical protein
METVLRKFTAKGVLPALMAAAISTSHATHQATAAVIPRSGSGAGLLPPDLSTTGHISKPIIIALPVLAPKWTRKMQKRFDELARLEAFGRLSAETTVELDFLSRTRERLLFPRTAEDIVFEMKERQLNSKLRQALREYVAFHNASENQKRKASG